MGEEMPESCPVCGNVTIAVEKDTSVFEWVWCCPQCTAGGSRMKPEYQI